MCGIGGAYSFAHRTVSKDLLGKIFIANKSRGTDASGFCGLSNIGGPIYGAKAGVDAGRMVRRQSWTNFDPGFAAIIHARAATHGSSAVNANNHPIIGDGCTLVHNGVISNHKELFSKHNWTAKTDVDSEILLRYMEMGPVETTFKQLFDDVLGSFTFACLYASGKLVLVKHSNPLFLFIDKDNQALYFSSVDEVFPPEHEMVFGFPIPKGGGMYTPAMDSVMVLDKGGLEYYETFKPRSYTTYTYSGSYHADDWPQNWRSEYEWEDRKGGRGGGYRKKKKRHEVITIPAAEEKKDDPYTWIVCPHCTEATEVDESKLLNFCRKCSCEISPSEVIAQRDRGLAFGRDQEGDGESIEVNEGGETIGDIDVDTPPLPSENTTDNINKIIMLDQLKHNQNS